MLKSELCILTHFSGVKVKNVDFLAKFMNI